jgi:hypothetical protein
MKNKIHNITTKPYTRWWWFSGEIEKSVIDEQLSWLHENGFGGVEISWVYPKEGTKPEEGPKFLDSYWIELVAYTLQRCKDLNLFCDLTLGSLWPLGGSFLPSNYASKTFKGLSEQRLSKSWESRYLSKPSFVLDHLNKEAVEFYFSYFLDHGFSQFAKTDTISFFCDSIEVDTNMLAYTGFLEEYKAVFFEEFSPYIDCLDDYPLVRYNYRKLISDHFIKDFFSTYVQQCHSVGVIARMQCHGALTNLLDAYALIDIPESEVMLFDPKFALIPSSAAAIAQKKIVSSESFSCMYGWNKHPGPAPYIKQEEALDIKCVADAQFAFGVNHVVWHGMPFGSASGNPEFYASIHVGPGGTLETHFKKLNEYLSTIGTAMRLGEPFSRLAVYFPIEDQWMQNEVPEHLKKPSSEYYWECQELSMPEKVSAFRPLWISSDMLRQASVSNEGELVCGGQVFDGLYCFADWMEEDCLETIVSLQELGVKVIFESLPKQPGTLRNIERYSELLERMQNHLSYSLADLHPVLESSTILEYWVRKESNTYYIFVAHPGTRKLRYPIAYKYYEQLEDIICPVAFTSAHGHKYFFNLEFHSTMSYLLFIDDNTGVASIRSFGDEIGTSD